MAKIICAGYWRSDGTLYDCGKILGEAPGERDSHGTCPKCYEATLLIAARRMREYILRYKEEKSGTG